jgi:hypothetical protein
MLRCTNVNVNLIHQKMHLFACHIPWSKKKNKRWKKQDVSEVGGAEFLIFIISWISNVLW